MLKNLNRGISTPIAIGIIAILVVIAGGGILAYQYYYVQKQEIKSPIVETPGTEVDKENENVEPYVKIISPNGGEQWKIGETHNITWVATGLDKVFIAYQRIGSTRGGFPLIIGDIPASSSTYLWKITQSVLREDEAEGETRGTFKIYIVEESILCREVPEDCISDFSDNSFTITR